MGKLHAAALLLVATVASAQPQPSPVQKQQASALVKQAIAKSQSGDHATAIELYLQAYALIPQPLLLSNIGSEYQQENKPVEALKYFCKYLDADPTGSNASYATAQAKTLQLQMGNKVDDKDVCKPKAEPPPPPPPPPPDTGSAAVPPETGSGQVTGTVDLGTKPAEPADHGTPGKGLEYAGLGVAAVGAIGLGAGIYFGIQAKNASDTITNHKASDPWPANIKQIEADGQADENKQVEFLIGGGVALVAGGVLYFIGHARASSGEHVSIAPVITPNGAGLAVGGSY